MGLMFDYENEIQFQFHLEIVPSARRAVNKLKMQDRNGKASGIAVVRREAGSGRFPRERLITST
jgi:hypothetical protein